MSTYRATTSKSGQRQADYSNIGVVGRKTGAVLKDSGARDQYGMPTIDDLFSSPQRVASPLKPRPQQNGISKLSSAQELDPRPDATQYSSPRKSAPPRARSPIKTSIGSPRKSLNGSPAKTGALLASPVRMGKRVSLQASSQDVAGEETFADSRHKRRSFEQAPKRPPAPMVASAGAKPSMPPPRRNMFEIPSSPAVRMSAPARAFTDTSVNINGRHHSSSPAVNQMSSPRKSGRLQATSKLPSVQEISPRVNGRVQHPLSELELVVRQDEAPSPSPVRKRAVQPAESPGSTGNNKLSAKAKGKRRLEEIEADERSQNAKGRSPMIVPEEEPEPDFEPVMGGFDDDDNDDDDRIEQIEDGPRPEPIVEDEPDEEVEMELPTVELPKRPPADPKSLSKSPQARRPLKRPPAAIDNDDQEQSKQPSKKLRPSPSKPMPPPAVLTSRLAATKQKDANIATIFGKKKKGNTTAPPAAPVPVAKSRPKKAGRLQSLRDSTEPEIDGARYTRSGRTSVKPVEYWRGERVIYTEPRREGGRVSLPGIKEVIRVEDSPPSVRAKSRKKSGKTRTKRQLSPESEEDIEQEWEENPGVFTGAVPAWDTLEQRGDPEYAEQVDLAIAPLGLATLTRSVHGANFQYAKTITLPFFHSGMVDLPPGGEKRPKNSRRNHIVFWIFSGRVVVDIAGNEFSLGRGGMWQVPRGCMYSVKNPFDRPARIFFSQGCYMTEEEGALVEEADAEAAAAVSATMLRGGDVGVGDDDYDNGDSAGQESSRQRKG